MNNNCKETGLTLVELLVCILLMCILLMVAMPQFDIILARMESKRICVTLQTIIHQAKFRAYSHHQRIAICGSLDGETCHSTHWDQGLLIFNDSTPNRLRDSGESIINYISLDLQYGSLQWRGFGVNGNILFQSNNGLPRGSGGSFHYCSQFPEQHRRITLSYMGHISFNKTPPDC